MPLQSCLFRSLAAAVLVAVAAAPASVSAQALSVERLAGGVDLVVVSQPFADATTIAWVEPGPDGESATRTVVTGRLTLAADVEAAFADPDDGDSPFPGLVVAVGGGSPRDLAALLGRMHADRPVLRPTRTEPPTLVEGGFDRRLGPPGSDAHLRLEVLLPPADDWRRSSVEVLWELVPEVLPDSVPPLAARIDGELGVLEGRIDAELADVTVREIRLALARFAADPSLQPSMVDDVRRRVEVRRQASSEEHPTAAISVLERWRAGGEAAVRELLFGLAGVTETSVRAAAAAWLPGHPGRAQLTLPPRVFNPRFAGGPVIGRLDNDVTTAVLGRRGAPLSVVCLRPVLVPDLDGEVTATVLARLARELRAAGDRPGWIRVRSNPALLEVAGPADGFGELMEQLAVAYRVVSEDRAAVTIAAGARRRALDLMAGALGVTEGEAPSPATLLRPGNLALGVVAADSETAGEALAKFWETGTPAAEARVDTVGTPGRRRVAAPGDAAVTATAIELGFGADEATSMVIAELFRIRAARSLPEAGVRVLRPFVPGRSILVLEIEMIGTVHDVEGAVEKVWPGLVAGPDEDELAAVRRRVAAQASAEMSGVSGHARQCAATAAGASRWRQPAEFELELLSVTPAAVKVALDGVPERSALVSTAAGRLPITEVDTP